jgi:hypothetical protein
LDLRNCIFEISFSSKYPFVALSVAVWISLDVVYVLDLYK